MTIRLHGGLGNQLFQLLALRYLAHYNTAEKLEIFTGHLETFKTKRSFSIVPFLKDETILMRSDWWNEIIFKTKLSKFLSFFSLHAISSVQHVNNWKGQFLNGYFQDIYNYKDLSIVKEQIKGINATVQSGIEENKMNFSGTDCAIHLRLTDFIETKKQLHYLNSYRIPYVKRSMDWFRKNYNIRRFILFSDAPAHASELINGDNIILYNDYASPGQSLFHEFCSLCSFQNMIGSNSTFSFWAGLLGTDKNIVFPQVWDMLNQENDKVFQQNLEAYERFSTHRILMKRLE